MVDNKEQAVVPAACTLDTGQARGRLTRWRVLASPVPPTIRRLPRDVVQARYGDQPRVREELARLAALEAQCCPFLTFTVEEHADVGQVVLSVRPVAGATPDAATLLEVVVGLLTGKSP